MAIAFDAASSSSTAFGGSSITWSHTCSGSDRFLTVATCVTAGGVGNVSGVTYNAVAMTNMWSITNGTDVRATAWRLIAPATGAHNIVVSFTGGGDEIAVGATSWTGVDQTTPIGTPVTATGNSGTATVDVSSASGEVVVDGVGVVTRTFASGAGQTPHWEVESVSGWAGAGQSSEPGAATVTMSYTLNASGLWLIGAVAMKPVGGGGGGGDHPASKRFGGVPFMAFPGRGNVWAPVLSPRMLIGPSSNIRKAA